MYDRSHRQRRVVADHITAWSRLKSEGWTIRYVGVIRSAQLAVLCSPTLLLQASIIAEAFSPWVLEFSFGITAASCNPYTDRADCRPAADIPGTAFR